MLEVLVLLMEVSIIPKQVISLNYQVKKIPKEKTNIEILVMRNSICIRIQSMRMRITKTQEDIPKVVKIEELKVAYQVPRIENKFQLKSALL
jgi:hypothetical protein